MTHEHKLLHNKLNFHYENIQKFDRLISEGYGIESNNELREGHVVRYAETIVDILKEIIKQQKIRL